MQTIQEKALFLLKQMLGGETSFRSGQWDAIKNLVVDHKRVLLFQKKSGGRRQANYLRINSVCGGARYTAPFSVTRTSSSNPM
jgi:hypothetical protein